METNQLDSDSHLPPRKRLLAEFKKLNGSSSSSATSNSNGSSSSASTDVYTHLDDLLASRFNNDHNQSPEELAEAARSAAASAVKAAKTARAVANEKALISAKAIAAAKRALELVDSFPKEAMPDCKERSPKKNKQRKHVPLHHLYYSKGEFRDEEEEEEEEDLALRLHRAVDKRHTTKVLGTRSSFEENGQINKKQKMIDVAGVVDSIPTPGKEESNSLGRRRRGRVKLKKLSLSIL
ncbi:hypothetical protein HID58_040234 [Brassica napus]|uniref:Uncharacterized protein n=1 Tax=Brassica napus TaxID=3708 RepID=A0ABQ8B7G9_BRANA|nr:uncharacterized protein BNAC01G03080D [Brassica napus]KAH0900731.1 hypothetical protein HID58_040234 [Brassica napus]